MAFLQHVFQLMNAVNVSGGGGAGSHTTSALDLRGHAQRIVRVNSILVIGTSVTSTPDFTVEYAGGVTCNQFQSNLPDLFQPFTDNDPLLENSIVETLQIVPMPSVYAPFVRFKLTATAGSPTDTLFSLWALCQERFDV